MSKQFFNAKIFKQEALRTSFYYSFCQAIEKLESKSYKSMKPLLLKTKKEKNKEDDYIVYTKHVWST